MEPGSAQVIAIVLAGGDPADPLARSSGVACKALAPLNGKPLGSYVLEALAQSSSISRTVLVGDGLEALLAAHGRRVETILEANPTGGHQEAASHSRPGQSMRTHLQEMVNVPGGLAFAHSLALGVGAALALSSRARLLMVSADVPWLTGGAVDRFIAASGDLDLAYPIVPEEVALSAFPTHRRTFVRLRQGRFTGGNLMLLKPRLAASLLQLIDSVYRARKNPIALAGLIGPGTLGALITGRADLPRLERLVSERLKGRAGAVISRDACLAADVDRPQQLVPSPGVEVAS